MTIRPTAVSEQIDEILGSSGTLAGQIDGFVPRPQQQQMAVAVAEALADYGVLVAEAGTGTGKTFAYLVPALLSGRRTVISTGTRNLQDQLFQKDLPVVRNALGVPLQAAVLKGRSNYLCRQRLAALDSGQRSERRFDRSDLTVIRSWAGRTRRGDIAEVGEVAEDATIWPLVTSTVDNCLGSQCSYFNDCHVFKARRDAFEADLVVVNHHLLFADMAVKDEGFSELLPTADAVIVDEAHQLPAVAGHFFGVSLSSRQLTELARDTLAEQLKDAPDFVELRDRIAPLEQAVSELRLALGPARRATWYEVADSADIQQTVDKLRHSLTALDEALAEAAVRGKGLEHCHERCQTLAERLQHLTGGTSQDGQVLWFETRARSFTLSLTPLDVAPEFQRFMTGRPCAWVFVSATLAVGERFEHFAASLGLDQPRTLRLDSPFDFAANALLYHPQNLPDPNTPQYLDAVIEATLPVLEASRGRAFVLFTSHQALNYAADRLKHRLSYPLLVQGTLPRSVLLERFRALGNAVLLGTQSFWEGVDVRGEALSCVVIVKLPFASPGDPVIQARIEARRRLGGNPFFDYQIPQAVITLKQGVGRLIRDVSDRGVLVLCDPRLLTKSYGRLFLDSLPPMTRTRSLKRIQAFFAEPSLTG